ncbi:CD1375 family protein [Savagea faecisuis]|uniref:CD1375 family protein n=1 Tax=Savagea faecisuis TaxID=1274803 RepID=A0ABW3GWP4_9BACL
MVYPYMIPIYAFLVKVGSRTINHLPEPYQIPVAEYLANEAEAAQNEAD